MAGDLDILRGVMMGLGLTQLPRLITGLQKAQGGGEALASSGREAGGETTPSQPGQGAASAAPGAMTPEMLMQMLQGLAQTHGGSPLPPHGGQGQGLTPEMLDQLIRSLPGMGGQAPPGAPGLPMAPTRGQPPTPTRGQMLPMPQRSTDVPATMGVPTGRSVPPTLATVAPAFPRVTSMAV